MFEVVRNIVIESGNDFVDLLLPTGIHILTQLYGLEKFSKRLLIDPSKAAGYLRKLRKHGSQFLCFYFISIFYLSNLLCMAGCYPCLVYIPGSPPRVQLCRHCQKPFKTTTLWCCSTIWGPSINANLYNFLIPPISCVTTFLQLCKVHHY